MVINKSIDNDSVLFLNKVQAKRTAGDSSAPSIECEE
jgi:hypothetical protein